MENFGQVPQQEGGEVTQEQVIKQFVADPMNRELLGHFIDQLQAKIERREISDFDLNMTLVKLYEEAANLNNDPHILELVADTYYDLATIALDQIKNNDLYEEFTRRQREWDSKIDSAGNTNVHS